MFGFGATASSVYVRASLRAGCVAAFSRSHRVGGASSGPAEAPVPKSQEALQAVGPGVLQQADYLVGAPPPAKAGKRAADIRKGPQCHLIPLQSKG